MKHVAIAATFVFVLAGATGVLAEDAPYVGDPASVVVCEGYEELLFCGELNGDCKVSAVDALIGLRMAVGEISFLAQADLDLTGAASASDALKILRIAVGSLPPTYSCDPGHIVLDAVHSGAYFDSGFHLTGNYAVGWFSSTTTESRDYFVFDLSSVDVAILSAKLRADTAPKGFSLYRSSDPSETFQLVQISTNLGTLTSGAGGVAAFNDLSDGTVYGSVVLTAANIKQLTEVSINAAGLAVLNSAIGQVAFGGSITTLAKGGTNENIFNSTTASLRRQLVLTIAPVL